MQHLYGRAGHIQPRAQVLWQHRYWHLSGDTQVGLLQNPLPCTRVLALQQLPAIMQIQTLEGKWDAMNLDTALATSTRCTCMIATGSTAL